LAKAEKPTEDILLEREWQNLLYKIKPNFKRKPNLQSMLFLIGLQEFGNVHRSYSKEEKQDLMHVAVCKLMSEEDYFLYIGKDEEGWPHFEKTTKVHPQGLEQQEKVLKRQILRYFEKL